MKILFISLTNIGDVILTLPVLDTLKENFPQSQITVVVGPRTKEVFENNPGIYKLIIFDKHSRLKEKIRLFNALKKENFDMVIDLRNSLFGALLPAKHKTSISRIIPAYLKHMKERHLYKIQKLKIKIKNLEKNSLYIKSEEEEYINGILKDNGITAKDKIIIISAGARSHIKRWSQDKFAALISSLIKEFGLKVILVGDKDDIPVTKYISEHSAYPVVDLSGKTNIMELACLLKNAAVCLSNDSAVLHLASYLNIPTIAIFGPTDELKYGPWSEVHAVVKKDIFCRPCEKAQCRFGTLKCMEIIKVEDVLRQLKNVLMSRYSSVPVGNHKKNFPRILVVRTDRIGDVVLSTPVIKTLRDHYPHAYIAIMLSPYAKEIMEGNPYLDEVIVYDKDIRHRSWVNSIKFTLNLKKKRFNLAIILHPTNRVHLVTFFAGIAKRIGYNRKLGFLLTNKIKHIKQLGERHELEYNLDLLRCLGIEPEDKSLFMPIRQESEKWVDDLFQQEGINRSDKLLAIHPGASCPSKIWPNERFAEVAERIIERYGFKVLIVAGPKDILLAQSIIKHMHHSAVLLAGKTSLSQLASVLKRCQLFISNDSGPVHIASAVGIPVISIFGRNQKGLSPKRWGPVGKKDRILHREVGCIECLAHNCLRSFACLQAITVADVLKTVDLLISDQIKETSLKKY